jgi:hypothetical protein
MNELLVFQREVAHFAGVRAGLVPSIARGEKSGLKGERIWEVERVAGFTQRR